MKIIFIYLSLTECCKPGWLEYGSLCILPVGFQNREIYPEKVASWKEAKEFCEGKNSNLISITNAGLIWNVLGKNRIVLLGLNALSYALMVDANTNVWTGGRRKVASL